MSFAFRCPKCESTFTAANAMRGRRASCPACHERVYLPRDEEVGLTETWQGEEGRSLEDEMASKKTTDSLSDIDPAAFAASMAEMEREMTAESENPEQTPDSESPSEELNDDAGFEATDEAPHSESDHDDVDDDGFIDDDDASEAFVAFGEEKKAGDSEMDMTPMVDVTFLLLIFFMVTAAFAMQKAMEVPPQENNEPSTQVRSMDELENDPDYVIVRVDAYNTFQVLTPDWEDEAPSKQDLIRTLRRARGGANSPTSLMVIANGEAMHVKVVDAIDAGASVGMNKVQLVTVEEDDE